MIWHNYEKKLDPLREALNQSLDKHWDEWEVPRQSDGDWPQAAKGFHAAWWEQRLLRQRDIDASIGSNAESEYLFDRAYEDNKKVRVSGPFTVESLSHTACLR